MAAAAAAGVKWDEEKLGGGDRFRPWVFVVGTKKETSYHSNVCNATWL